MMKILNEMKDMVFILLVTGVFSWVANLINIHPDLGKVQLMEAIKAVFRSWDNPRAIVYRRMNDIPGDWGTAVNVQTMVFGNKGNTSGTGVAFTRNPSTGAKGNKPYSFSHLLLSRKRPGKGVATRFHLEKNGTLKRRRRSICVQMNCQKWMNFFRSCGSLFVNLVQYQVSIASKQQELQSVQNQLSTQLTENAELSGTLDQGESAIIERYAREQGYAKPNERVFVDISGK